MLSRILNWIVSRRTKRQFVCEDVQQLLRRDPVNAYYDAQRAAARARLAGEPIFAFHWAKVAAEIARISDAEMDFAVVEKIVDEEERRAAQVDHP